MPAPTILTRAAKAAMLSIADNDTNLTNLANSVGQGVPQTTKGDFGVNNGTTNVRFPVGATLGHVIKVNAATELGVEWGADSGVALKADLALDGLTTGAALVANTAQHVNGIAQLRLLTIISGKSAWRKYHTTAGDGGHVGFRGVTGAAPGTYVDNNGTIVIPAGGDGSAAWVAVFSGWVNVLWFGVQSGVSSSVAFSNAYSATAYGGTLYAPKGDYIWGTPVTFAAKSSAESRVTFRGDGVGTLIQPSAAMTDLLSVTGAGVVFRDLFFANASSYATNGIKCVISSGNASRSLKMSFVNVNAFTNGTNFSGQNYDISDCDFQDNDRHIYFLNDGRNSNIHKNYLLGGRVGIELNKTTVQCEGTQITENKILVTVGNGSGILIHNGLEVDISRNIIDQSGANTSAINMNAVSVGGTLTRINVEGNWLAAGASAYGLFASGNVTQLDVMENTFAANGAATRGLDLNGVNKGNIEGNNWLMTTGSDYLATSCANLKLRYNTDRNGASLSADENPFSATWTPVVTSGTGTITTYTATGTYKKIGPLISFYVTISITTNGTAATSIIFTLPPYTAVGGAQGTGREDGLTGNKLQVNIGGTSATVLTYNNAYPGGSGASILVSGVYFI